MTCYSLQILEAEGSPEDGPNPGRLIQDLNHHARQCGSYLAAAWAKARGLDVHYRDNCWIYVPVDRGDLEALMAEVLQEQENLAPDVLPGLTYLLMAEEY